VGEFARADGLADPAAKLLVEERHASTVLVDLDAETVELDLMKPAIPCRRLFPICRSARRNEDWMQHSSGYTKRLKSTSMDL
jgi:hypothetical protein